MEAAAHREAENKARQLEEDEAELRQHLANTNKVHVLHLDQEVSSLEDDIARGMDSARRVVRETSEKMDHIVHRYESDLQRESTVRIEARKNKSTRLKSEDQERRDAYWNIMEQEGRRQEREAAHEVELSDWSDVD